MRKVFIIGAHRSGTSKLASYFSEVLGFSGHAEGHVYRLLSHLKNGKADIVKTIPENAYEVNRVGFERIFRRLTRALDALISEHHGHQDYYDKTPGYRMIDAAPLIHRHIPEARFIHLHRNGIDNVRSNMRLWPDRHFDDACRMWASSIRTYFNVRAQISDRLLELEMGELIGQPWAVHQRILAHLELEHPVSEEDIRAYFASGSSTSTTALDTAPRAPRLDEQGWSADEQETFIRICGEAMDALGYTYR
ncbi:MAG: sulfotransferase [Pseudomonadota bacterium]